jgi:protein-S-isoprenylcysteine O-methyltransferase Ste14
MVAAVMPEPLLALIALAYASLAFELTALHVPSAASSLSIWSRPPAIEAGYSAYRGVFALSGPKKAALLAVPLSIVYGVYAYPLIAAWGVHDVLDDHAFTPAPASNVAAALLIAAGRLLTLGAVVAIRRNTVRSVEPSRLHTSGLFRYSRNPGLVGMYVFVLGLWLAAPSLTMLAGIAVYVLYMDFKVRMEEDFLEKRFGTAYVAYRRRTGRYWP